jgi:hypothetical protein
MGNLNFARRRLPFLPFSLRLTSYNADLQVLVYLLREILIQKGHCAFLKWHFSLKEITMLC